MKRLQAALLSMIILMTAATLVSAATRQPADLFTFAPPHDIVGQARLDRTNNSAHAQVQAEGAEPGMYTMWWVIWNTPEGCATPWACVEADLFNPNAGLAIGYAGGGIAGDNGKLTVAGNLHEGVPVNGFAYPEFAAIGVQLTETAMIDIDHAELHLVLRHHGELIPGMVDEATHTFNGACVYDPPLDPGNLAYGAPGPNTCADLYAAIFASPEAP